MNPSYNGSSSGPLAGGVGPVISSGAGSSDAGDLILSSDKGRSKKWILVLVAVFVLVAAIVAGVLLMNNTNNKTGSLTDAYWTYMNYLIKGDSSKEKISRDDYRNSNTAVKEKFEAADSGYFIKLDELFSDFKKSFSKQSNKNKSRYENAINDYSKVLNFVVALKTGGTFNEEDEYVKNKTRLEELQMEYRNIASEMGCLVQNEVNEDCLLSKTPTEDLNKVSEEMYIVSNEIKIAENFAVNSLLQQSWGIQNMLEENENEN